MSLESGRFEAPQQPQQPEVPRLSLDAFVKNNPEAQEMARVAQERLAILSQQEQSAYMRVFAGTDIRSA